MTIERDVPLARLTTLQIGGAAGYFCRVRTEDEIREALDFARAEHLPVQVLGGGSNVLIADGGVAGLVVKVELPGVEYAPDEAGGVRAVVAAGQSWDAFVADVVARGLWGVENLSGIPGTVGAAPIQNIGAYGAEVAEVVERVDGIDMRDGSARSWTRAECAFAYRDSFFKTEEGKHFVITRVVFRLSTAPAPRLAYRDVATYFADRTGAPTLAEIREAILAIRSRKFPDLTRYGTAGSFFKNPIVSREYYEELVRRFSTIPSYDTGGEVKIPAAWLIEHVGGFRGQRRGAVGSFESQALVMVNYGGARAKAILAFAEEIRETVCAKTGIELQFEVQMLQ